MASKRTGALSVDELRDEAIALARRGVAPQTFDVVEAAVRRVAASHTQFTTDEVWAALVAANVFLRERRALGAVMQDLSKRGVIRATETFRKSTRPACHGRPVRVWEPA